MQEIKHDHADIEVIIITGYGSLKSAMEGIGHGAAGYLLKPFNVTELITLVNQTLEKKQRLDYLRGYLQTSTGLWGADPECAKAWREMRAGYEAIGKSGGPMPPWGEETADLLPMLSDLLEAKDRQLLNHCSRVSFTPPCSPTGRISQWTNKNHLPLARFSMTSAESGKSLIDLPTMKSSRPTATTSCDPTPK